MRESVCEEAQKSRVGVHTSSIEFSFPISFMGQMIKSTNTIMMQMLLLLRCVKTERRAVEMASYVFLDPNWWVQADLDVVTDVLKNQFEPEWR